MFAVDDCAIAFDQKKLDLNAYINGTPPSQLKRRGFYVVRIGNKSEQSPNKIEEQTDRDGRLITTPPRLRELGIKRQSFRRIVDPFIWNFMLEKNKEDDTNKDNSLLSSFSSSSSSLVSSSSQSLSTDSTTTALLHPPVPANKKRKLENGVSDEYVSSKKDDYYSYPNLSSALGQEDGGFNPTDSTVRKKMRAVLAELIDLLSNDYELNIIDSANNSVSYVRVPKTSSD